MLDDNSSAAVKNISVPDHLYAVLLIYFLIIVTCGTATTTRKDSARDIA